MIYKYLLFDDHPGLIRGVKAYLDEHSYWRCAGTAQNCDEAVALFDSITKDLTKDEFLVAFVDASFAEKSDPQFNDSKTSVSSCNTQGFEIIRHIKHSEHPIPCIVYSSFDFGGFVEFALGNEIGADGYILKNTDESVLISALNEIVHGRGFIQKEIMESYNAMYRAMSELTKREREIFDLACEGKPNTEIAKIIKKSVRTVENYMTRLYDKFSVSDRQGLLAIRGRN